MLKNADCTLYEWSESGYTRRLIEGVYWIDHKGASVQKSGLQYADGATVYIYSGEPPQHPAKDLIVRGNCPFQFDNSSAAAIAQSLKSLKAAYHVLTVTAADDFRFGGLPHIEVNAK